LDSDVHGQLGQVPFFFEDLEVKTMPRERGKKKRRVCNFCIDKVETVDYKEVGRLRKYITERGKILPRRISGNCAHHQRQLTIAIKRARQVALLPYSSD
jgi:small subunit ribosomal protein S18